MHTKALSILLVFVFFAGISACSVYPETFDERLATAYITNTSVRSTAAAGIRAGKISADQGRNILRLTDQG